jgi:hypothetical protein
MLGIPLLQTDMCILIAYGLRVFFKGHGYSTDLLNACIEDSKSKGKVGLCILSSTKKKPFLADPKYLKYKGFTVCNGKPLSDTR